jgi:transcriptional regulator with XRE-family HTH domain
MLPGNLHQVFELHRLSEVINIRNRWLAYGLVLGATVPSMGLIDEKRAFSKRLVEAMHKAGIDTLSPTHVARAFNLRYHGDPVSTQSVRKWLTGRALPSQDKLRVLAEWLGVAPQWLRFGDGAGEGARRSGALRQETRPYRRDQDILLEVFSRLNERHRKLVLDLVEALAAAERKR